MLHACTELFPVILNDFGLQYRECMQSQLKNRLESSAISSDDTCMMKSATKIRNRKDYKPKDTDW